MNQETVLYDSCVLYPAALRNLLMHLALTGLYRARWSNAIHEEWMGSLSKDRPDISQENLNRIRDLMNAHIHGALVTGYEHLIGSLELPDPGDRHVLAAAICCGASTIVTRNLKDFPREYLGRFQMEAQHPDDFLMKQKDLALDTFCAAVKRHRASLRKPAKTVEEYLATLEAQGLVQTAAILRKHESII